MITNLQPIILRSWLVLLLTIPATQPVLAKNVSPTTITPQVLTRIFESNWQITPTYKAQGPGGTYEGKALTRYVTAGSLRFYVGNIVYYKFPKQDIHNGETAGGIAEKVRYSMGLETWHHRKVGAAHVYETKWKSAQRFVRLYITEQKDSYTYSIAMIRLSYADAVVIEAELLQRKLAGVLKEQTSWLDRLFAWIGPEEAHAECAPEDIACLIAASSGSYSGMTGSLGAANTGANSLPGAGATGTTGTTGGLGDLGNLSSLMGGGIGGMDVTTTIALNPETNSAITGLNANMGATNTNLDAANKNWSTTNQNLTDIQTKWSDSNKTLKDSNKNWAETNDLMREFMDPKHAFVWAAASAAGAAVGAMTASLVVDTLVSGGKAIYQAIYEAITHEKEEARLLEAFKKARENWEKVSSTISELEKAIDSSIELRRLSSSLGLNRETAIKLSALLEEMKIRKELKQDDLRNAIRDRQPRECIEEESQSVAKLGNLVAGFELVNANMKDKQGDAVLCDNLQSVLSKLRAAEGLLQKARTDILAAQDVWLKDFRKESAKTFKKMEIARNRQPKMKKEIENFSETLKDLSIEELDAVKSSWEDKCVRETKAKMGFFKWLKTPVRKNCRASFSKQYSAYLVEQNKEIEQRAADRLKSANEMYKYSSDIVHGLRIKGKTLDSEFESYVSWFKMLQSEQACSLKDPGACPPAKFSAVLERINQYEAREGKIKDLCQGQLIY
ncbi:MAG: hypothetical protein A2X97_08880 [Bdellovibrionales bacterium GWA1_52_35]|nr:MAG: hypothetical protein A2X97_08880 [Bdellovibrionales bacterium GWA1_52_35]HCM38970.1 hypothetical protein [Bdellovibrionales bacterium]